MPTKSALRQFKAALFETLANPTRIKLLTELSQVNTPVAELLQHLDPAERAEAPKHLALLEGNRIIERHETDGEIYYSLDSPALKQALLAMSENPSLSKALSDPLGIEILESLRDGPAEHARLIRDVEPEERPRCLGQLEILIGAGLINRTRGGQSVFYEIKHSHTRNLLEVLRAYFEEHLSAALAMISQISFAHIDQETARLKKRLHNDTSISQEKRGG